MATEIHHGQEASVSGLSNPSQRAGFARRCRDGKRLLSGVTVVSHVAAGDVALLHRWIPGSLRVCSRVMVLWWGAKDPLGGKTKRGDYSAC